jgi:hypothetical protein
MTTTTTTTVANGFVAILDYAAQSVTAWSASAKQASRANVLSTYVLCQAWPVMTFQADVTDKKGDVTEVISFDLYDMVGDIWDKHSNAQKSAMSNAVLAKLFSCPADKATPAIKAGLRRSLPVAHNIVNAVVSKLVSARADIEAVQEQIRESVQLRQNKSKGAENGGYDLRVPYVILHDAPKDDAKESAIEKWEAYKDKLVTCDGSKDNGSYADMARAVAPKREASGPKVAAPKAVAFDGGEVRSGESLLKAAAFLLGGNTLADTEAAEGLVDWLAHDRGQLIKAIRAYQDAVNG